MSSGCGDPVLVVEGAVKRFRRGPVVGPLWLRVSRGELVALIGPNGAGKTTTMRMILGIYPADEGRILVCGEPPARARGRAAFVPEETAIYPRLTGWEHLVFYSRLYTGSRREALRLAERAAGLTGLGEALRRKAGEYSKGMKRRLLLGFALALETPLLLLDEPTSGLDVEAAVRIRSLIRAAADSGRAVLMTSHNMLEVERLADRVVFIASGRVLDEGAPRSLLEKYGARDLEEAFVKALRGTGGD